jgi:hypothetical protein
LIIHQSHVDFYRRQVETAFRRGGHRLGSEGEIAEDLWAVKENTDTFVEQGDYARAIAAFEAIIKGIIDHFDEYDHEADDLYNIADACIGDLDDYLATIQDNTVQRQLILGVLFAIFRHDVDAGGVDFGKDAVPVLVESTTIEERQTIANWVRGIIKIQIERGSRYELQEYQKCLSALESGRVEDH